jgi:hypothetical protein
MNRLSFTKGSQTILANFEILEAKELKLVWVFAVVAE